MVRQAFLDYSSQLLPLFSSLWAWECLTSLFALSIYPGTPLYEAVEKEVGMGYGLERTRLPVPLNYLPDWPLGAHYLSVREIPPA